MSLAVRRRNTVRFAHEQQPESVIIVNEVRVVEIWRSKARQLKVETYALYLAMDK